MGRKLTIKQWRLLKGQTQKEFSENVGMKLSTYQLKESGQRDWTGAELICIKNYLGVSLEDDIDFSQK